MDNIELGDKVKCKYSGFVGVAVSRTEFINGCVQYGVMAQSASKAGKFMAPEELDIDSQSLEVIKKKKKPAEKKESTGGAMRKSHSIRGF